MPSHWDEMLPYSFGNSPPPPFGPYFRRTRGWSGFWEMLKKNFVWKQSKHFPDWISLAQLPLTRLMGKALLLLAVPATMTSQSRWWWNDDGTRDDKQKLLPYSWTSWSSWPGRASRHCTRSVRAATSCTGSRRSTRSAGPPQSIVTNNNNNNNDDDDDDDDDDLQRGPLPVQVHLRS